MYGLELTDLHQCAEDYRVITDDNYLKVLHVARAYDLVCFEIVDVFTRIADGTLLIRRPFKKILLALLDNNIQVGFSLRKSFSESEQIRCIQTLFSGVDLPVFPAEDPLEKEAFFIRRAGEDLSFRKLRERFADKKILYLGTGFVNEFLLPQYYGIHTMRILDQYECLAPYKYSTIPNKDYPAVEDWREKLMHADVVSFDIFDTLLYRDVLFPEDVFAILENANGIEGFSSLRIEAQKQCPSGSLNQIYGLLADMLQWSEKEARTAERQEVELEKTLIHRRDRSFVIYRMAIELGKRIILCSEMYFSEKQLRYLLDGAGVSGYEKIFVSCEYGAAKNEGLFQIIRDCYAGSILHIGDSIETDGKCIESGIQYYHMPSILHDALTSRWKKSIICSETVAERNLIAMVLTARERAADKLHRYAVSVVAPIMIGYTDWLLRRVKEDAVDSVLFFSRDGWLFKQLYDWLPTEKPPAYYFHTSRRAALRLIADTPEALNLVVQQSQDLSPESILSEVFGLRPDKILQRLDGEKTQAFLLRHKVMLRGQALKARKGYQEYNKDKGIDPQLRYAVCDMFSAGSTQKALQMGLGLHCVGFYAGNYKSESNMENGIQYYFKGENTLMLRNYIELEAFLSAPFPSVDHIEEDGNVVYCPERRDDSTLTAVREVQQYAIYYAKKFLKQFGIPPTSINPAVIEEIYAAQVCEPVIHEAYNDLTGSYIKNRYDGHL